jgi:hypothetical protein
VHGSPTAIFTGLVVEVTSSRGATTTVRDVVARSEIELLEYGGPIAWG